MNQKQFQAVGKVEEVPPGASKMIVLGETLIGLFNIEGEFFALDNCCPHAGASLAHGEVEEDVVVCRIHHWRFSIRDGKYLDECRPEFDAKSYRVRVVGDRIEVEV
ncbi:MAG: Rieske 2Fe-2S domain-containing protein [Mariniblastus sp.]|nr:Rieske 2Fe-2S domain-containing protein [Mariniblastus sp.]